MLSEITRLDYFHVENGIELDGMVGKHKIERYISCLIRRSYPELNETDNSTARQSCENEMFVTNLEIPSNRLRNNKRTGCCVVM